jgi:hypothetical protein
MSCIRRFIFLVLAIAVVVAGMLLAAGLPQATAGSDYAAPPKSTSSANFVTPTGRSGTAVNAAVPDPCLVDPDYPGCSGASDPPLKHPHPHPHPDWTPEPHHPSEPHFYIPPIHPIRPIPIPPICQATVPNLVNLTQDQARRAVTDVGLALGSYQSGNYRIASQTPVAGTRVLCGWFISVTVDQPPPPPPPLPPPPPSVEIPAPDPPPAVVVPLPPPMVPPAVPVSRIDPLPWFWPVIIALLVLSAALLLGLLLLLTARARKGPKWVHTHVRAVAAVAEATPGASVEVMESRTDHSAPPCVVRLEPHADSGLQVLEEVGR